jgi:hypothetical protein
MTNLPQKSVRYNRVFVNNRVRYNRVSLYFKIQFNLYAPGTLGFPKIVAVVEMWSLFRVTFLLKITENGTLKQRSM